MPAWELGACGCLYPPGVLGGTLLNTLASWSLPMKELGDFLYRLCFACLLIKPCALPHPSSAQLLGTRCSCPVYLLHFGAKVFSQHVVGAPEWSGLWLVGARNCKHGGSNSPRGDPGLLGGGLALCCPHIPQGHHWGSGLLVTTVKTCRCTGFLAVPGLSSQHPTATAWCHVLTYEHPRSVHFSLILSPSLLWRNLRMTQCPAEEYSQHLVVSLVVLLFVIYFFKDF